MVAHKSGHEAGVRLMVNKSQEAKRIEGSQRKNKVSPRGIEPRTYRASVDTCAQQLQSVALPAELRRGVFSTTLGLVRRPRYIMLAGTKCSKMPLV